MTEVFKAERPDRPPTHPGAILRDTVLPALNMPVSVAARHLGVTRQQLHKILAEESNISPEMALRLGKFCGNGPGLWSRMQEAYGLWQAKTKLGAALDAIPTVKAPEAV